MPVENRRLARRSSRKKTRRPVRSPQRPVTASCWCHRMLWSD